MEICFFLLPVVDTEKYKEKFRYYRRSSFTCPNSFGPQLKDVAGGLTQILGPSTFAFTGTAATVLTAPFVDMDQIELFAVTPAIARILRVSKSELMPGPQLRVTIPYDPGVFMYMQLADGLPLASDVQAFLDLYARGGRDLKQAEYVLANSIEPRWR